MPLLLLMAIIFHKCIDVVEALQVYCWFCWKKIEHRWIFDV